MTLVSLGVRNVLRERARLVLTLLGVGATVLTFLTLRTALGSWDAAANVARKDRLVTRQAVTMVMPLPRRYATEIRAMTGVRATTFMTWFGGRDPAHAREFFPSEAVDVDTFFDVYDELVLKPDQREAFVRDKASAMIGAQLASKMGWKLGDRVSLESPIHPTKSGEPWTFTIAAIYDTTAKSLDRGGFYLHWSRLDEDASEAERDQIGMVVSRAASAGEAGDIARAIDARFADREAPTLTEDERAFATGFMGMVTTVLDAVAILSIAVLVAMGLVLANTIAMGVRERTHEYAAMRAIGFGARHILVVVLLEATVLGVAGAALGAVAFAGLPLRRFFEEQLSGLFPVFAVDISTIAIAFAAAGVGSAIAALVPALRAARTPLRAALRKAA